MPSIYAANDGSVYEKSMGRWSRRLAIPFIQFSEINEGILSILDVGCGTGSLALTLGEVAPKARITGLDYSQAFVDYARSKARSNRFSFDQGDAMSLPYESSSFDASMSMLVLSFLDHPERAVREMVRVTRSGGLVAAAVWDFFGGHTFSRILLDTAAPLDPDAAALRAKHCSLLTRPGAMAAMWKRVGLRDVRQSEITIRMDFESFNTYGNHGSAVKVRLGPIWSAWTIQNAIWSSTILDRLTLWVSLTDRDQLLRRLGSFEAIVQ